MSASGVATLCVRNRHLLILTVALVLVAGVSALLNLPRVEDPRITTRNATVVTALPGASAVRVEALVTKKLEDVLREVSEIKHLQSTSRGGVSVIGIELADWVGPDDNEAIFSKIRDKLADAELPPGASQPQFDDKRGAVAYSLIAAVVWDRPPALGIMNRLAEALADRFRNLYGSEQVVLFGAVEEELTVSADPAELAALGLTVAEMASRLSAADVKTPSGVLRTGERQLKMEVEGALDSIARVAAVPLIANGRGGQVSVGDVATVARAWQDPPREIALADGRRAVLVAVRTEAAIHLGRWAEQARAAVAALRAETGAEIVVLFDQSEYTQVRLNQLGANLLAGAGIVVLVVFFTMGWRAALVVASALPLSAALGLFGLAGFGQQIHQMSIFGMIVAIGLLIDNAIVMTEAVRTRRRAGLGPVAAVAEAVRHLFSPLFASTFTTILGFMPIFLLPGNVGDFVGPIATAVVLALAASFVISITIIPALAALLALPRNPGTRQRWWRDGWHSPGLTRFSARFLQATLKRPLTTVLSCMVLPIAGFVAAGTLGNQFFPPADRDQFEVQFWLSPEVSVRRTAATARAIEAAIREQAPVRGVSWVNGGSSPPVYYNQLRNQDDHPAYGRGTVLVSSAAEVSRLVPRLQDLLAERFPQAQIVVRAFGQGPPIAAPVSFRIVGEEIGRLREYGETLRRVMHTLPDITHTRASIRGGEPKLWLAADEREARAAGLTLGEIAGQFQGAMEGVVGGQVLEDLETLPVRVRYGDADRSDPARVGALRLLAKGGEGGWIPASALGELTLRPEPSSLTRRDGERVNIVEGWIRQGALPIDVTRDIRTRLAAEEFQLAPGYRLEEAGDSAEQRQAIGLLLTYAPVLAVLMLTSLVLSFRSFAVAGLIGAVAVLSLGLGMLSLWAGGYPLGFNPIIGSAGLVGVAINASIVVLAAIRADAGARAGDPEAIAAATLGAARHIVSTTLTTVAGFIPLLVFTGGEFWPPLAIVIAGGVGLSITLGLLFTPAAYRMLARVAVGESTRRAVMA